jgi:hypothetical protein
VIAEMDGQRLAAGLIAGGVLLFAVAGVATPQGLYQAPEHATRLQIIDDERARFLLAQALWALMLAVPAAGLVAASRQIAAPHVWLPTVAAVAIVVGAAAGVLFVVLQTVDPLRFWLNGGGAWASAASAWLIVLAAALYGVAMFQAPGWGIAGYVLAVYAAVGGVALLLGGPPFYVVAGFYVAALAPAFVLWQGRLA